MKKLNTAELIVVSIIGILCLTTLLVNATSAEQEGESPESEELSILKETYTNLQTLGYGSDSGSNSSSIWNRIITSATWVPNGSISEDKVIYGYTFFNGSRDQKTGTFQLPNYAAQSQESIDLRETNIIPDALAQWTKTNMTPEVWKDERTGLYWSPRQGSMSNEFTIITCDFFTTTPRGNYSGSDPDCGNAINTCATLSLDADSDGTDETNWYLPSQIEMMQAYIDGIYAATNKDWVTENNFWSSTESKASSGDAYPVYLSHGYTYFYFKTDTLSTRCVRRG